MDVKAKIWGQYFNCGAAQVADMSLVAFRLDTSSYKVQVPQFMQANFLPIEYVKPYSKKELSTGIQYLARLMMS